MSKSYENLKIWQESVELATYIYKITKDFPKDEQFGIVSQIRRAIISVPANISEGSSRKSKKDYVRFIDISIGSLNEVENFIIIAYKLKYLDKSSYEEIRNKILSIGLQLGGFRKYLSK